MSLVVDTSHLASGLMPLAILSSFGSPAVLVSLLNILIVAGIRYLDLRARERERRYEIDRRLELEAARNIKASSDQD
jgi:hypothetical protein